MSHSFRNKKIWTPSKVWDSHLHQDERSEKSIKVYEIISQIDAAEILLSNKTLHEISKELSSLKKENSDPFLKKIRLITNVYYDGRDHVTEYFLVGERKETDLEYEIRQEKIRSQK